MTTTAVLKEIGMKNEGCCSQEKCPGVSQCSHGNRCERKLLKKAIEEEDREAVEGIFSIYGDLLGRLAFKYKSSLLPYTDAYQVAAVGLMKAIRRYDPDRGSAFKFYAYPNIEGELKKFYRDDAEMIRLPRRMWKLKSVIKEAEQSYLSANGTLPTPAHLSEILGIEEKVLLEASCLDNFIAPLSIDKPTCPDCSFQLGSILGRGDPHLDELEDAIMMEQAVEELPESLREVFELRMKTGRTQASVAKHLGISQMQVSRLESRACGLIRDFFSDRDTASKFSRS
ncbi:MAG: sigma-70 family RNA polymerase sigma factor [Actinobacteria bacterium]|nr:sigma-70 family RNA polymerase sigma factor [Actinomycetota bacterium]